MQRYTLEELGLVDPTPEPAFVPVVELASRLLGTPVSLLSIIQSERDRQYFKAGVGIDLVQTPLSRSFCRHVVSGDRPLVVEHSLEDYRVWDNPAIEELGVRAYLGVPVHDPHDAPIAALCVISHEPRAWSRADLDVLEGLARCVSGAIRLKHAALEDRRMRAEQREFSHAISHDMKAPLHTVGWLLEELSEEHDGATAPDAARLLRLARETIARARDTIDELLELSLVDEPRELTLEPVALPAVLEDVLRSLGGTLAERDARVHVPPDLPTVSGDACQLTMLFANLVGNALKFHRPGIAPRVRIAWRRLEGAIELSVTDNGTGIPPEHHGRVFRPFERLGGSEGHDGSGIGLSLVLRVVENHGGSVRIESDGRTGTAFLVRLPHGPSRMRPAATLPAPERS